MRGFFRFLVTTSHAKGLGPFLRPAVRYEVFVYHTVESYRVDQIVLHPSYLNLPLTHPPFLLTITVHQ